MKRASLKTAKVPVTPSPASQDVTDRLLDHGDSPARKPKPKLAAAAKRRTATAPTKSVADTHGESLPFTPYRPVPEPPPAPRPGPVPQPPKLPDVKDSSAPIAEAIEKTRVAVDALQMAMREVPARHDLAVRYRLDALAHHLEQVAEFLAGHVHP